MTEAELRRELRRCRRELARCRRAVRKCLQALSRVDCDDDDDDDCWDDFDDHAKTVVCPPIVRTLPKLSHCPPVHFGKWPVCGGAGTEVGAWGAWPMGGHEPWGAPAYGGGWSGHW